MPRLKFYRELKFLIILVPVLIGCSRKQILVETGPSFNSDSLLAHTIAREVFEEYVLAAQESDLPIKLEIRSNLKLVPLEKIKREVANLSSLESSIHKESNLTMNLRQLEIWITQVHLISDETRIVLSVSWGVRAGYVVERKVGSSKNVRTVRGRI